MLQSPEPQDHKNPRGQEPGSFLFDEGERGAKMKGASTRFAGLLVAGVVAAAMMAVAGCVALTPMVERTLSVAPTASIAPVQKTIEALATLAPVPKPSAVPSPIPEPPTPASSEEVFVEARVTEVIDGDTIEVEVGDRPYSVRYIGIDTPEVDSSDERLKKLAAEATAKNSELVAGKIVRLERDVSETDHFGRLLRYVWVGDLMVNSELVKQGYAMAVTYKPDVKHQAKFMELEQQAQADGVGLWATTQPVANEDADPAVRARDVLRKSEGSGGGGVAGACGAKPRR
jgi:micrococcal nuclease